MLAGLKGSLGSGVRPLGAIALAGALCLSGCGGGGGSSSGANSTGISLSLSSNAISVAANTLQPAPVGYFSVDAPGLAPGKKVYIAEQNSARAIWAVQNNSGNILPISVTVQFLAPASIGPGTYDDQITISMCMDQACTQPVENSPQTINVTYTVTKEVYAVTGLSPASVDEQSSAFSLTVQGSNFTSQSVVLWNGASRTTHYLSSTELTADIPATDIAAPGVASVTVNDPAYQTTNAMAFTVLRPAMVLNSLSPASVTVGGSPFTLTVLGDGFSAASAVQWNGTALTTTYVSDKELLVQVPAGDIASLGTASITVNDSTGAPTTAGPQSLTIAAVSKDAISYQMNAAHNGAVNFNNLIFPFPSTATWTADVGGTPSYALIVQGKVILGVPTGVGSGEELIALDQGTGNTVWGPVVLPAGSQADPIYDNGRLFILDEGGSSPSLLAFDAGTGNQDWSVPIANFVSMVPAAGDGMVFVAGYNPNELYAFDESTGSQAWTRPIPDGLFLGSPAVTADGVYVADTCRTYDFRPATGEIIWQQSVPFCSGASGRSVVANGLVYSGDQYSSGDIYDAESGTSEGTYTDATWSAPAIGSSMGFFLQESRTLQGFTLSNNTSQWSFTGDGMLNTPPIVVNQYVFIASYSPNVYAIDSTTGNVAWTVNLVSDINGPGSGPLISGLAAGDGFLVVSAGTKVFAFTLSTNP